MVAATKRRAAATKVRASAAKACATGEEPAVPAKPAARGLSKSQKKTKPARIPALKPRALVQRIYKTIDGELTKLEKQAGKTSQDRERASRALSQMVSSLEKAVDMQRDITRDSSTKSNKKDKEALAHAEDLRREIAERLERLNRKRATGKRST